MGASTKMRLRRSPARRCASRRGSARAQPWLAKPATPGRSPPAIRVRV